jgi:hypothetical protein
MQTTYNTSLTSVESPANANLKYGETKIVSSKNDDGISKYTYEDDYIHIVWFIDSKQFNFVLTNKSGFSIKLPWDDMAYVNEYGKTMRVIHSGIKLIDRNAAQATSVVPKNATLEDILIPSDNIYFVSGQYGGWREKYLFPQYSTTEEANNSNIIGKKVRVTFPIIIQDIQNEYIFEFSINGAIVK